MKNCSYLALAGFVCVALLASCGGGGGGGGGSGAAEPDPVLSDQLTSEGVDALVTGDDDFAASAAKLRDAIAADPSNTHAPVFLAIADFFTFTRETSLTPPPIPLTLGQIPGASEFRELYEKAGYTNVGGSDFWDFQLEETNHGEGDYKDSAPTADEVVGFLRQRFRAEVLKLISSLDNTPTDFEYRITTLDAGGTFFDDSTLDDTETVWIDYGDIAILRSTLHVCVALLDYFYAYSFDDLDPNDFDREDNPGVDCIALFADSYTEFGDLVRQSSLASSQQHIEQAFSVYKAAAQHILAESTAQRSNGLFTPYRDQIRNSTYFNSTTERDDFIDDEAEFRTWAQGIVDSFGTDSPYEIATDPDGTAVPADERTSLNFYRFWQGVPFRDIYMLTKVRPTDSERFFAVSELPANGDDILTMDGVIDQIEGSEPTAGDLMTAYRMRIDSPPVSTKTIDGSLSDWTAGTNAVTIFRAPAVVLPEGYADAGEFHIAVDGTNLYIAGTADFTGSPFEALEIDVESAGGFAYFWNDILDNDDGAFGWNTNPTYSLGSMFEMAIPLSNFPAGDSWVEIEIGLLHEDDPDKSDNRTFSDIHVKIR